MFLPHRIFSVSKCSKALLFVVAIMFIMPTSAHAENIVDALNLAPFVPLVLNAFMAVATAGYDFFVGNGTGIIYLLIWGFLAMSLGLYLVKMYLPKSWVGLFGFSGGGEMVDGKMDGFKIATNMLQPIMRAVIASVFLLQIRPVFVTQWLINPFLQFGALYTESITQTINESGISTNKIECPQDILDKEWISPASCEFLIQPVANISHANNQIIKRGFDFLKRGLRGLMVPIPHGGEDFLNVFTGIVLIATFFSCNMFMALLIIQAIFNMGMALILYPFKVLVWVAKSKNSEKWFDIWPAFQDITKALQDIVITMIACVFITTINIAVIKSLFQWSNSVFVVAAGGTATSNVPTAVQNTLGFGSHSILWLSSLLTFYLMFRIFDKTKEQLQTYTGGKMDGLYKKVSGDAKFYYGKAKALPKKIKDNKELIKDTADTVVSAGRAIGNGARRVGRAIRGWF